MNRWLIEGRLTTRAPLHIGSGEAVTRPNLTRDRPGGGKELVEVAAVLTDHEGRAHIPGSTLKGVLRAWLKAREEKGVEQVFGSTKPGANAAAGRATFRGASADSKTDSFTSRLWDPQSFTDVVAGVAIDRRMRTASDEKLFHAEVVPPGVTFNVLVEGRDLDDDHVKLLLRALAGFDDPERPVAIGSRTNDGWGRCHWTPGRVIEVDAGAAGKWIDAGGGVAKLWDFGCDRMALADGLTAPRSPGAFVEVEIELSFDGGFLVNDPRQAHDERQPVPQGQTKLADRVPLRDARGGNWVHLPASSFRGAFRAQAERIFRTLGGTTPVE
ncbi:MAG TPA: RAMP superfamily CRISPR-associated protein, partial [Thermoleophilia bacterium]|nr:RAMP superfamily CRISPR-associated protein [Thermoleophilia bacterium]